MSRPFELRYHKSQPQLEFTNEAKRLQSIDGKVVNNRSALGQLQVSLFIETDRSFLSCGLPDTDSSFVFRAMSYLDILDSHQQEMDAALMSLIADLERIQRYVGNSTLMVSGY